MRNGWRAGTGARAFCRVGSLRHDVEQTLASRACRVAAGTGNCAGAAMGSTRRRIGFATVRSSNAVAITRIARNRANTICAGGRTIGAGANTVAPPAIIRVTGNRRLTTRCCAAVSITTCTITHAADARRALRAGVHVGTAGCRTTAAVTRIRIDILFASVTCVTVTAEVAGGTDWATDPTYTTGRTVIVGTSRIA